MYPPNGVLSPRWRALLPPCCRFVSNTSTQNHVYSSIVQQYTNGRVSNS